MIRAVLHGARDLRLEDTLLDATLAADEIYVETECSAFSTGTDLANYAGRSTEIPGAPSYPRGVGYSNVGVVRHIGGSVNSLAVGQRVFSLRPHQSAYIARANELLIPVPHNVSSEQASLAYLTQLGMAALRQAQYEAGESVAVVGLGVIGLGTVGVARAMGARVTAIANSPLRAEAARSLGAHCVYLPGEPDPPRDIDLVVLTANPWRAYRLSVEMARYRGRVAVLGFPGREEGAPDFNPLDPEWFYGKQLSLIGSGFAPRTDCAPGEVRFNLRRNLEYILALMANGELRLEPIITHRLPAARMREAYELAHAHSKELMAAVFDWRNG